MCDPFLVPRYSGSHMPSSEVLPSMQYFCVTIALTVRSTLLRQIDMGSLSLTCVQILGSCRFNEGESPCLTSLGIRSPWNMWYFLSVLQTHWACLLATLGRKRSCHWLTSACSWVWGCWKTRTTQIYADVCKCNVSQFFGLLENTDDPDLRRCV